MKQLISDWVLATKPEPGGQTSQPSPAFAGIYADGKLLSDEIRLLLLTYLYLELHLTLEHALRAARADIMLTPKAQNHRLSVERPR
jgi:hypothetical protein